VVLGVDEVAAGVVIGVDEVAAGVVLAVDEVAAGVVTGGRNVLLVVGLEVLVG